MVARYICCIWATKETLFLGLKETNVADLEDI